MEAIDFPRGGLPKPPEDDPKKKKKESKKRPSTDFLFGSSSQKEKKTSSKKPKRTTEAPKTSLLPLGGGAVVHPSKGEPYIEALGFAKLAKGVRLLAVVREVHADLAILSLPHLWTAYILRDDNAAPCDAALRVGQFLAVQIVKAVQETTPVGLKRRIQVTAAPVAMNPREEWKKGVLLRACVTSVEDHGVICDLGLSRQGFLTWENATGETEDTLVPGRLLDVVLESTDARVVALKVPSPQERASLTLPSSYTPTLNTIWPGTLVHATVERVIRNGLCVSFGGGVFRGAIESQHLGSFWIPSHRQESDTWKTIFNKHRSLQARVIAVDAATKIVRLSLLPHLLALQPPPPLPPVGSIIEQATVIRLDQGVGALLALPERLSEMKYPPVLAKELEDDEDYQEACRIQTVYVHISKAMDGQEDGKTPEAAFAKAFAPSTQHTVRILSVANVMEGVASGACAETIVNAHVLTHSDLQPGKIYKQVPVCTQLKGGGVLVDFGMGVRGLIPPAHLFDQNASESEFRSKVRQTKYAVGARVDVRILSMDETQKRCMVTAKKALIKADDIITSFAEARVGQRTTGYVTRIDDQGLSITFFNNVYGRVTARSLVTEMGIENHRESFSVGDVVDCRVVNKRKRSNKRSRKDDGDEMDVDGNDLSSFWELTLSLKTVGSEAQAMDHDDREMSSVVHMKAGAILPPKSLRIMELVPGKQKDDSFVPGYAIVSIKSKYLVADDKLTSDLECIECKLPYDQLFDEYDSADIETAVSLDNLASKLLIVGKKINRKGLVMTDPKKAKFEYSSGVGKLTVVSIRPKLIEYVESRLHSSEDNERPIVPDNDSHLYVGAEVVGYVTHVDPKHGAFIRFLDGLTGLLPKKKGGLLLPLFGTVTTRIIALDITSKQKKILLSTSRKLSARTSDEQSQVCQIKNGTIIVTAKIEKVSFNSLSLKLLDDKWSENTIKARLHCTMAKCEVLSAPTCYQEKEFAAQITKFHPFYGMNVGDTLSNLRVISVDHHEKITFVDLTNRDDDHAFISDADEIKPQTTVTGIVTGISSKKTGIHVALSPSVSAFAPTLELSNDVDVLNDVEQFFPIGACFRFTVIDKTDARKVRSKFFKAKHEDTKSVSSMPMLSILSMASKEVNDTLKPREGDLVVGRINRSLPSFLEPALMLDLRGGYAARCCITELEEPDEWVNMPLGRLQEETGKRENHIEVDEDIEEEESEFPATETNESRFPHGKYISCRVLSRFPSRPVVDVSLRQSRLDGDIEDDQAPDAGDIVQAFVVDVNKKGCFLRLSRQIEGRVILKELCDGFLPNPAASFPMGRLVAAKVKEIHESSKKASHKMLADLDMRESVLIDVQKKLKLENVNVGDKFKGTVTRIEEYGVFVRLDNSEVFGLVHKSECSDKYIKDLSKLYDPGDRVKVLVLKKNEESKQLGFSMKASHFENDDNSDDDESIDEELSTMDDEELESDDENYASKLASKIERRDDIEGDEDESATEDDESEDESSGDDDGYKMDESADIGNGIDTNIGFDWNATSLKQSKKPIQEDSDDKSDTDESGEEDGPKSSHKSRKKRAERRKEEQEIVRRETALADGTADESPETAADFERLLAGEPNSSEIWIRYMAFHLTMADVPAAREVAERAFGRIQFREEREKLNVWSALLALEYKFGSYKSFADTIDRACQHNNPKQVYLRTCEMLEKEAENIGSREATTRADAMFTTMCRKFRDKKTVWIVHLEYLLKTGRQEEAYVLSKRALQSLPEYKHVETMSTFAQLVFAYGSAEKARTLFDGLLARYPKRLDLFFVYVDKEVKHGDVASARSLFERAIHSMKLKDKQMKKIFKKWYSFEEQHGNDETRERVKDAAREYVERSA